MSGISTQRNIGELALPVMSVPPQSSAAATVTGTWLDRTAHGSALSAVLHGMLGAVSGAPSAIDVTVQLQDATSNGGAGAANFGPAITLSAADTDGVANIDLSGAREFVAAVVTVAFTGGTSPAALVAADVVLGGEQELPAV
jgi:hypothetical protein